MVNNDNLVLNRKMSLTLNILGKLVARYHCAKKSHAIGSDPKVYLTKNDFYIKDIINPHDGRSGINKNS